MRLAGVAMLGVVISAGGVLIGHQAALHFPAPSAAVDSTPASPATPAAAAVPVPAGQARARRVYPFSIVPGGVTSRAELAQVIATDKVAADHYAGFDVDKAHPVTVAKARAVYVSYRKDGQVYWTSKKVMLAEGEILLSDGVNEIRTRCGNRISETRRLPVSAREPAPQVLDTAMEADDEGAVQPIGMALPDDEPGAVGSAHGTVTFAGAAALTQNGFQRSPLPMAPLGMPDLPRGYEGRPATIAAPQAAQIKPAPARGSGGADGGFGAAVGGRGSGDSGARTAAASVTDTPASVDFTDPLGAGIPLPAANGAPALPPLADTLAPIPAAPLAPAEPNAGTTSVPEPGSLWLSAIALGALAFLRRKRRPAR